MNSLEALEKFLLLAIRSPGEIPDIPTIAKALKSQSGMAALSVSYTIENDVKKTTPMSLNTLKLAAARQYPGGFKVLNDLRKSALDSLNSAIKIKANKQTKQERIREKTNDLKLKIDLYRRANIILLQAIHESLEMLVIVRDTDNKNLRSERAKSSIEKIRSIESLLPKKYD